MARINAAFDAATIPSDSIMAPAPLPHGDASITPASDEQAPAAQGAPAAIPAAYDVNFIRVQVLLDRAHFSPGVIDGRPGENVAHAVKAYRAAHGLPAGDAIDAQLMQALSAADMADAIIPYVITQQDVAGPFVNVPGDLQAMSRLNHLGYASAAELIAEKFHMDEDFLRALNPNVDFTRAGVEILVANRGGDLVTEVARIEVDKASNSVRAFDAQNQLIAHYPATIGSADMPSPSGDLTVRAVAFNPTYRYDPARLPRFGPRAHGALTIKPGPNNPVGLVWIALSEDTYGIHGAPMPAEVGKTASHGCVRLTNWDAWELGRAVRAGVPVDFIEPAASASTDGSATPG